MVRLHLDNRRAVVAYMGDFFPGPGGLHPITPSRWDGAKGWAGYRLERTFGLLLKNSLRNGFVDE
jgi:hypothetical protein